MHYTAYSLNGAWEMNYAEEKYLGTENPWSKGARPEGDDVYSGTEKAWDRDSVIEHAVPAYWEDMTDTFAMETPYYLKLKINPEYGLQRYPLAGFAPDMALPNVVGNFYYRKSFLWEEEENPVAIYFGGVQNAVSVWVNEAYLGRHEGYSAPFEMEIPEEALVNGENTIVLSVSNFDLTGYDGEPVSGLTNRAANQYTGGVYGDVELRVYESPLRDICIQVSEDLSRVNVRLEMTAPEAVCWAVYDGEQQLCKGEATESFRFDTEGMPRWSPEDPHLLTLKVACGDCVLERVFGVRRLVAVGNQFRFNGRPYYLRGICEHCYFPETVHPTDDIRFYRHVIRTIKDLGFNFIRFHTFIPAEAYMQAADELGILMQVESPNNTSYEEWCEIVRFCRRHPSVVIYSSGNELLMDDPFIAHLHKCGDQVHRETDSLYSPMSALRGLDYYWLEPDQKDQLCHTPFTHHPRRIKEVCGFSDVLNTGGHSKLSYESTDADPAYIDSLNTVYHDKPLLVHEICIHGTYTDLSMKDRYEHSNIRFSPMFATIEQHLRDKGMLEKAPVFFRNSSEWQRRLRKHCFELTRLCRSCAGYDFLGPIDTHWHTFGYDVGMMNEFYELKPGETKRNVLMYNSETVLLNNLNTDVNFTAGQTLSVEILTSHYGSEDLKDASLNLRLTLDGKLICHRRLEIKEVEAGEVSSLCTLETVLPMVDRPAAMTLYATLECGDTYAENEWELYVFPEAEEVMARKEHLLVAEHMTLEDLEEALRDGKDVLLLGAGPFVSQPTSFRISLAGRTSGNLATVISDHPALAGMPHEGFCGWQFRRLMENGNAICFEDASVPFDPIIEVASSHKYAIRQAAMFEYEALNGRLLVCGFHFGKTDPAAKWLKHRLMEYAASAAFEPRQYLSEEQLRALANATFTGAAKNNNVGLNLNDKTAVRRRK